MCGITGYIDFNGKSDKDTLTDMTDTLLHRGPDDSGYEHFVHNHTTIGFGFRRLSIIELSALGHQPMHSNDGMLSIVFNGEIYNFQEIRKELENYGHVFKTNSDTEVILYSYRYWGKDCVKKFTGMFVIAIYDRIEQKIVLFRDRAGVKPLFYYQKNNLFLFASELKALHRHSGFVKELNFDALSLYFQHGYISAPYTIFKNTWKLHPGHILELSLNTQTVSVSQYWSVYDSYNQPRINISFSEAVAETEKILSRAFQYRMIADVPVGVFLSGGYDSSAVTALLQKDSIQKIKTFTIGFQEQQYNEAEYAKEVATHLGTAHTEYYCSFREAMDIIPQLASVYDEPMGDSSAIPTMLVSRIARQHVTVALSADGGDEIFAGYPKYIKGVKFYSLLCKFPELFTKPAGVLMNLFSPAVAFLNDYNLLNKYKKLSAIFRYREPVFAFTQGTELMTFEETRNFILKNPKYLTSPFDESALLNQNNDILSRFQAIEYKTYLVDDILQKVDRATMSVSLEGREPFLDHHLIEWVATLPSEYKLQGGTGKKLLREIVHRYIPEQMMNRPKMGFSVPVKNWCRHELKDMLLHYLNGETIRKQGLFNEKQVSFLLKNYFDDKNIDFQIIWFLFAFQMWHEKWM